MSRAKIGHEFCPMPRKWHAGWANHLTFHARGIRAALFELADGAPITIHGSDWLASLCNQMCVHGKDRPNVRKTLKAFAADGLIGFDGTHVLGRFLPDARPLPIDSKSIPDRSTPEPHRSPTESETIPSLPLPLESTPRNDSGRVLQTDRRDRQTEETEGACEVRPVVRVKPAPAIPTGPLRVWKLYAELLGLDPLQLGTPKWDACKAIEAAATAEAGGATSGPLFDKALRRLMSAWRGDDWVQRENPSIVHLAGNLGRYAPGCVRDSKKPIEDLEAAREAAKAAQLAANRLADALWWEKERPEYPQQLADARKAAIAAHAEVARLINARKAS